MWHLPQIGLSTEGPVSQGSFWRLSIFFPVDFLWSMSVTQEPENWNSHNPQSPMMWEAGCSSVPRMDRLRHCYHHLSATQPSSLILGLSSQRIVVVHVNGVRRLNCVHLKTYFHSQSMSMDIHGGMILTGETRRTWRKPSPSATLSTTNPIWTGPGANLSLCGKKPATHRLSHGTVFCRV
jgi:hypothetical protein